MDCGINMCICSAYDHLSHAYTWALFSEDNPVDNPFTLSHGICDIQILTGLFKLLSKNTNSTNIYWVHIM